MGLTHLTNNVSQAEGSAYELVRHDPKLIVSSHFRLQPDQIGRCTYRRWTGSAKATTQAKEPRAVGA